MYPEVKVGCLVAGMAAGADSIDDMGLLRHGAMPELFGGVRAPSTLGSFLRSFTWGNVRQLEAAGRELLAELARQAPLLPGADVLAFVDIDSMQRRVYGHKKQGAAFGHTKIQGKTVLVRGLNTLAATVCTPQAAPVITGTRLRGGSANTARGAASFAAEAIGAARSCGCTGTIVTRAGSGFYTAAFIAACRRAGAYFSVTARMDPAVAAAIAAIPEDAWTAIRYPRAMWDDQLRAWISDAEIAEMACTGIHLEEGPGHHRPADRAPGPRPGQDRRRPGRAVPSLAVPPGIHRLPVWLAGSEEQHRDHAVVEQVFADWTDGPLAHLPSGSFTANAAWLTCAAITCNLLRAAGCLACRFHAKARGATIRADLIDVAARLARRGRSQLTLHLPQYWHRESEWLALFEAACGPPARAA